MNVFIFIEARPVECTGIPFVRQRGMSPILFTSLHNRNPNLLLDLDLDLFDNVYYFEDLNRGNILSLIHEKKMIVSGIIGCFDDVMILASEVANELELPHPSLKGLKNVYSKTNTRDILKDRGFIQPMYQEFSLSAPPCDPSVPYPFVLKPIRDAGAYGVHLCKNKNEYIQTLNQINESSKLSMLGREYNNFIIEEFLIGEFYGAEVIYNLGEWYIAGINKIFVSENNSLCMEGVSQPADLSEKNYRMIHHNIDCWVDALELKGGALNIEFILTDKGPVLVEVNLRVAGARAVKQVYMTSGVDMIHHLINFLCGDEVRISTERKSDFKYVADLLIFSEEYKNITTIDICRESLYYIDSGFKKLPINIMSQQRNFGAIIGHVLACGDSCEEAMKNAKEISKTIHLNKIS